MKPKHTSIVAAVDAFAAEMKEKLLHKKREGWSGWSHTDFGPDCRAKMLKHIVKGDPVDVANFAMFLWNLDEPTFERDTYAD